LPCVKVARDLVVPNKLATARGVLAGSPTPLAALPEEIRRAVREEVRRDLADSGGPVEAEAEYRIASARR
jgi:hypothetical protein